ncbi:MAG: methionyl-tRNA formyltransferase [Pseudomonadota bacterium]
MKIVFAGTPDFALPALEALVASEHDVVAVYTQPDRPAGRGRRLKPGPIKAWTLDRAPSIELRQPASLRGEEAAEALAELAPDLMVVAAYGLILPRSILSVPRLGCWNIHASLLPRWRGAAPIARAVLAGDEQTGVCIMQMAAGLDTGDVLSRAATPIAESDTGGSVHDRLAQLGAELLIDTLARRDELASEPQDDSQATYAAKLEKEEANLNWQQPAAALLRQIRAFNPWPVARFRFGEQWLRVWDAELLPELEGDPGTIVEADTAGIVVATGQGGLRITTIQRSGGRPLPAADFLNAFPLPAGTRLALAETTEAPDPDGR